MSEETPSDFDRQMHLFTARLEEMQSHLSQPFKEHLRAYLEKPESVAELQQQYTLGEITIDELNERLPAALEREPQVVPVVQQPPAPVDPIAQAWDALVQFFEQVWVGIIAHPVLALAFVILFALLVAVAFTKP